MAPAKGMGGRRIHVRPEIRIDASSFRLVLPLPPLSPSSLSAPLQSDGDGQSDDGQPDGEEQSDGDAADGADGASSDGAKALSAASSEEGGPPPTTWRGPDGGQRRVVQDSQEAARRLISMPMLVRDRLVKVYATELFVSGDHDSLVDDGGSIFPDP